MPKQVRAFGQILYFPDEMSDDDMAKAILDNEHVLNPDFKRSSGVSGLVGGIARGAKQTGRSVGAAVDTMRGNLSGVEEHADASELAVQRDMPEEQHKLVNDLVNIDREQGVLDQIGDTLKAAKNNPMGTAQFVVEQAPNTVVSLGSGYAGFKAGAAAGALAGPMGAAVGGTLGFLGGMFLGNVLLETGSKAIEKASDEDGFTPSDRDETLVEGPVKAGVITGVDAFTLKAGSVITKMLGKSAVKEGAKAEAKVLIDAGVDMSSPATINAALKSSPELFKTARIAGERAALQSMSRTKKAGILGTGMALETVGEGVGEYAGEFAATGEPDVVDATMESLAGATQSAIETAYNFNKLKSGNNLSPGGIQDAANSLNKERTQQGIHKINKAQSVDEAINAANEMVSQKPATKDDVLTTLDPTLKDIERLTGLKPSEAVETALNQSQQGLTEESLPTQAASKNILSGVNLEGQFSQPQGASNEEINAKQKIQQATSQDAKLLGNDTEIVLPSGESLPAKWHIVDADSISASIKEGINQPRDRTRIASDMQIQGIANNPDYRRLSDSPVMDVGAPTISADGAIVGGNGRFEGINRAHEQGTINDYLRTLKEDAANKGIDPAVIDSMSKPILVRRITKPFDTRKLAIASNSGTSLQYSGLELAKIDAGRMAGIENLDITDTGDIALTGSNIEKLKKSLIDYTPAELASLIDKHGALSQDGLKRVRNSLLAKAYGSSETLGRLIESTDNDQRNVLGALTKSAGNVARIRAEIRSGAIPEKVDITDNLLNAVEIFAQIKAKGQPLDNFLAQQNMFGENIDPDSREILQFLHDNVRSQKKLTEFIKHAYDQISRINISTADIFGDNVVPPKKEIIKNAGQSTTTAPESEQQGLFKSSQKTDGSSEPGAGAQTNPLGSGKESEQDRGLKFSRSPEERLKDRERAKQLERKLNAQGYDFTVTAKDVRDFAAGDRSKEDEADTAERIAKIFGRRIVWIDAQGDFNINGVVVPSIMDTIFLDVNTDKSAHAVMGHELSHHMEHDVPEVYKDLVKSLEKVIKDQEVYAKKYKVEGVDQAFITKEIVGDIMGDNFTKPEFWNRIAEANPGAFKRIADTIIKWLRNLALKARTRGLGSEQWVTDVNLAQDIVAQAVAKYTADDNKQILDDLVKFNRSKGWYDFPNAIIAHRSVSEHKDYQSAKDGDFIAGIRLSEEKVTEEYLSEIKNAIGNTKPIVVPVRSAEKSGSANAIPEAVGLQISSKLGLDFDENRIRQRERIGRTGADGWHRIANQPTFEGAIEEGRSYVIVDDTLAQGGTVAQLKEYIEGNGGKVVLITALTGKQYSAKISLSTTTLNLLRDKHGAIESWFRKSFGYGFEGLTESEARFIISARGLSTEQVRERIAGAMRDGTNSNLQEDEQSEVNFSSSSEPKFSRSSQGTLFGNNTNLASQEELLKQKPVRPGNLFSSTSADPEQSISEQVLTTAAEPDQEENIISEPVLREQKQTGKIEDFGQKLGGARKDMEASLRKEFTDSDISTLPLSKIWPKEEALALEDPFMAAFAYAAREEIPTKPKVSYKVKSWVEKVKMFRGLTRLNVSGAITKDKILDFSKNYPGLENFFNKVQLLELIDNRNDWGRIEQVSIYPEAYKYDANGIKVDSPYSSFKVDGRTTITNVTDINGIAESVKNALSKDVPEKLMQFEIRGRAGSYFINKKGDKEYRPLIRFTDLKEASAYYKNNYDDLVAAWESVKESDNVKKTDIRSEENRPRTGQDWRNGKDVTPEQFQDAFGFRGVEFGNWVSQGSNNRDRQGMLNQAYDALMDLSSIVGVPPKAISLNGSLGLGFGSRGKGAALAHFEPGNLVINLTKTKGAGNLAHEWFHSLDNYFQRQRGVPSGANHKDYYITYRPEPMMVHANGRSTMTKEQLIKRRSQNPDAGFYKAENWTPDAKHPQGVRPTVERKFADLVHALDESPMKKRAEIIDKNKEDGYWSRIIERAARSFENYVIAKMMKAGYNNDYLANVTNVDDFKRDPGRYPYLLESEIAPIEEAFDNLFSEIKTKETEKGIALFSKAEPTQKSILSENNNTSSTDATTNEGISPERTNSLDIPGESRFRKAQRLTQDAFNRFTVIKEWLAERGINLSEQADVYAAEERYHSKVANQIEDFREQVRNPLIEKIAKAGFTMSDISDYLEAQHAAEANAAIQKLQNNPDATAYGITDEEAKAYLDKAPKELGMLANEFRDITEQTKKLRLDNGLLNKDITDAWEATYKHYIPVKGDAEANKESGKGLKVNFKTKRRLGHGKRDEAVIENILMDHERAIMEVEKNRVGKHVVMMAAEIGMPELMTIDQPEKRKVLKNTTAFEVQVKGITRAVFDSIEAARTFKQMLPAADKKITASDISINPTNDQRVIASASPMLAENEINVYMDGHAIRVQINDELLARAYGKLGIEGYGKLVAAGRMLNGYLSKIYTGYNPEFIITNIVRDFSAGTINLTGEEGILMAAKTVKNYPGTFASLLKYAATNGKSSNKWIDAYRANGGNTGAAYLSDMERLGNEVASEYASYQGVIANLKQGDIANASRAAGRKVFNSTLKWIYNLNQAGENAMRLAAFKAMLESGRTPNEAAHIAKNITVNFNRKGELGNEANAAYLFFNASVQGVAATSHALTKGKHKGQAWALATSMATLGYLAAAALAGGDEEDYDKVDDFTKERNVLIKSGDGYVKIPVPYGYGFFWNLGRSMADAQRKDELGTLPWHIASSAIEELTPFGDIVVGSDEGFNSDQVLLGLLPTALKIPFQPAMNKQIFSGGELMPESQFDQSQPDREKMWRGTKGTMYDHVAGWLEDAGMDVSPETLKHYTRTFTGGAGALVDSSLSAAMLKKEGAELEPNEMPFVRKAYTELTIREHRAAYHKAKEEAQKAAEEFDRARKRNDLVSMQKVMEDKREMIALDAYANSLSKVVKIARDEQDAVRLSDKFTVAEKRLKLKDLELREEKLYDQFLDVFNIQKIGMRKRLSK